MHLIYFVYGFITGIIGPCVAVSPMVIGMHYTIGQGKQSGLSMGLGNSTIQILWAAVAAFAMFSGPSLVMFEKEFSFVGAFLIFYIAYKIFKKSFQPYEMKQEELDRASKYVKPFIVGFMISFSAPQRTLLYLGVFAAAGVHTSIVHPFSALPLIFGVFLGSFAWWVLYVAFISIFRKRITPNSFKTVSIVGACILVLIGVMSILRGSF